MEEKAQPKSAGIVGECMPIPKLPIQTLFGLLEGMREVYILTNKMSLLAFKGQTKNGMIRIPQHARDALGNEEVFVGVIKTEKIHEKPEAKGG